MKKVHLFILLLAALLVSCMPQKRLYRPGFYMDRGSRKELSASTASMQSTEVRKEEQPAGMLSSNDNCNEAMPLVRKDSVAVFKTKEAQRPIRILKQQFVAGTDSLPPPAKRFPTEKKAGIAAVLTLVLLLGAFISSPVGLVCIGLALVFAILALLYGIHAKKEAKAAGRPVPKSAKQAIIVGIVVSGLIVVSAVLIAVFIRLIMEGRIPLFE